MDFEAKAKRTIKDSVFTHLFRDKKYLLQLYKALFEDDEDITEDDLEFVTIENVLVDKIYNDLGFLAKDKLLILVEAQSKWDPNIAYRMLLYIVESYRNYVRDSGQYEHSGEKITLPEVEPFIIYTGERDVHKGDKITFSQEFFSGKHTKLDLEIKVLLDGKDNDIIAQYVTFTRICTEQYNIHGKTLKAIEEAIRICKDKDVLREYLSKWEKEVITMVRTLFDQETVIDDYSNWLSAKARKEGRAEGEAKGRAEGEAKGRTSVIEQMRAFGMSEEDIAKILAMPEKVA